MLDYPTTYQKMREFVVSIEAQEIKIAARKKGPPVDLLIDAASLEYYGVEFLDRVNTPLGMATVIGVGTEGDSSDKQLWFLLDSDLAVNKGISYWRMLQDPQSEYAKQFSILPNDVMMPLSFYQLLANIFSANQIQYWMKNYQLTFHQAYIFQEHISLRERFLCCHALIKQATLLPELWLHIVSYLAPPNISTKKFTDLFEQYVSGRYRKFFFDPLEKRSLALSHSMKQIDDQLGMINRQLTAWSVFFSNSKRKQLSDEIHHLLNEEMQLETEKNKIDCVLFSNPNELELEDALKTLENEDFYKSDIEPKMRRLQIG
ncbi:MAG: hypothetical protein A3F11_01420 [Gammaproteobacteria bacterium RIFCSPHIGHO2_12_FULL_37_14]|nr:MAG: hypothetical protein A3F11_01420 [Gammaproteobacteria bacterium RIFCSPHIGHO2_12_FULL_37_14]